MRLQTGYAVCLGTAIVALGLVAGCPQIIDPTPTGSAGKLVRFQSADEMLSFFRERVNERRNGAGNFFERLGGFGAAPLAFDEATAGADAPQDADDGGSNFTTTNLQEADVDESDVIKTDGTHIYIARGNALKVVRAAPASELAEIGALDLDVYVSEMYLRGDALILLAQQYTESNRWGLPGDDLAVEIWPPYFVDSQAVLVTVDISDPTAPVAGARIELDGSVVSSRLVNDRVVLVLAQSPGVLESASRAELAAVTLEDVLPKMRVGDSEEPLVDWEDSFRPESPLGHRMTTVVTLDADDITSVLDSTAIVADAGTIYASSEALYVTDPEFGLGGADRESTTIHQFTFDEDGIARYAASGDVPGRLLNQFSLSEHEGYLRVATHVQRFDLFPVAFDGGRPIGIAMADAAIEPGNAQSAAIESDYNALYVLQPRDGELEITGRIEGIEPDERIYAARFMGDRGYLVTFRIIDPLLTLDLSDPASPRLVGELELPGYSDYLHPVGADHLIGVGRTVETTDFGGVFPDAVQLVLFDVSDMANPQLVQRLELGGSGSFAHASQTHKAFTFDPTTNTLALPVVLFDAPGSAVGFDLDAFVGTVCYTVDTATGFERIGRVAAASGSDGYDSLWWYGWLRSVIIGDDIYTVSPEGVRVAPRTDFDAGSEIELTD